MAAEKPLRIDIALLHYPVVNRCCEIIGSAVTNLDLHDLARAGRTYGIDTCWIVTPYEDQQELAGQIVRHWTDGHGGTVNPDRKEALSLLAIRADLAMVLAEATAKWGEQPLVLATCARPRENTLGYEKVRGLIRQDRPLLLLFGTAWGLAPEVLAGVDATLPPLRGQGDFNHLSVRSAVAIILDRLLGLR
ncbi:MAG: RNA methyltransferase [Desulfobulbus sp.]|nr:MAG: RNA methyltransferase [Desulfobulbus sp.]